MSSTLRPEYPCASRLKVHAVACGYSPCKHRANCLPNTAARPAPPRPAPTCLLRLGLAQRLARLPLRLVGCRQLLLRRHALLLQLSDLAVQPRNLCLQLRRLQVGVGGH